MLNNEKDLSFAGKQLGINTSDDTSLRGKKKESF